MSNPTHRWADEVRDSVEVLKAIHDEVKVQAHLAKLEARARFALLQQRLKQEQGVAQKSLGELAANLRQFKAEIVRAARRSN